MGDENIVLDPAYEALQSGKEIHWQEVVDPASFQMYVYIIFRDDYDDAIMYDAIVYDAIVYDAF